ncbi:MAG: hypothetical protein JXR77_06935 [Lentisphaeria bacterium]|nr:hypothetical protein [Lentisphaeria bacterium]
MLALGGPWAVLAQVSRAGDADSGPPAVTVFHLADAFDRAERLHPFAGIHTTVGLATIEERLCRAIHQHPNNTGEPRSQLVYRDLQLPRTEGNAHLALRFSARVHERSVDGVGIRIDLNQQPLWAEVLPAGACEPRSLDLDPFAGQRVTLTLTVEPAGNNHHDSFSWIEPRIVRLGTQAGGPAPGIPELWPVAGQLAQAPPNRIVLRHEDDATTTIVSVQDECLDLAAQVTRNRQPRAGTRRVPLGPRLVVGEGPDPENHTFVQILNPHGLADIQFLAFPPEITGGVRVAAGRDADGRTRMVAAAICPRTRQLRVFNECGGWCAAIEPPSALSPPYLIATGNLLPRRPGDEIAVIPERAVAGEPLCLLGFDGFTQLVPVDLDPVPSPLALAVDRQVSPARLLLHDSGSGRLVEIRDGKVDVSANPDLAGASGVFVDAAGQRVAARDDPRLSVLTLLGADGQCLGTRDVGRIENLFWVVVPPRSILEEEPGKGIHPGNRYLAALEEGRYVRFCSYGHYRADAASPGYRNPAFGNDDPAWWAGEVVLERLTRRSRPAVMWEPCFTHRGFGQLLGQWEAVREERTGLPKYMMVSRLGNLDSYIENVGDPKGADGFHLTTYAFGLPDLDHLYLDHLSKLLLELAAHARTCPEANPSLEPNHENEIPMAVNFTVGDYNPSMVAGFLDYLLRQYGSDLAHLNDTLGTPFTEHFDAPRWQDRGPWDEYGNHNPFFREWMRYNRRVVSRRLAQASREALLAGFPPEFIKYHQIPDTYISGGDLGFSRVQNRITPIDWAIRSGTGYGWTRYGIWYKRPHNVLQGGWSSGQDTVLVGEYNSLTESAEDAAAQLEWMFDHGVMGIHVMGWRNDAFNRTMGEAVQRLIARDRPRPGPAGGVGQLHAWHEGGRRLDIVALGTSARHTGLLKSLHPDGSWEGSVYTVPFKAHVDVEPILREPRQALNTDQCLLTPRTGLLLGATQFEVTFEARQKPLFLRTLRRRGPEPATTLEFAVCHADRPLPGLLCTAPVTPNPRRFRFVHRIQLPTEGLRLRIRAVDGPILLTDLAVDLHRARFADIAHGVPEGQRHRGGITFDILRAANEGPADGAMHGRAGEAVP